MKNNLGCEDGGYSAESVSLAGGGTARSSEAREIGPLPGKLVKSVHGESFGKPKQKLIGKSYHPEIAISSYKDFVSCWSMWWYTFLRPKSKSC